MIDRILLVNSQVDIDADVLRRSLGTVGSLAARLAASLNDDGSLKTAAVDAADHNIADHTDGSVIVGGVPISYVRMLADERTKLEGIADGANDLTVLIDVSGSIPSNISAISTVTSEEISFTSGQIHLKGSDSITWRIDTDGGLFADTTFPTAARHRHYYDITPSFLDPISPNYKDYKVVYAYKEGSMRVYINGVRLSQTTEVLVPTSFGMSGPSWVPLSYTEDVAVNGSVPTGIFSLSDNITASDDIRVDFDALYNS